MKKIFSSILKNYLPIYKSYENLKKQYALWKVGLYPPGHYYSPVVGPHAISAPPAGDGSSLPGIELHEHRQVEILKDISAQYRADLFPAKQHPGYRYYFDNEYFSYSDAIFLHLLIRYYRPDRIIEIGSGFSSAVMMDTNEKFFNNSIKLHFIEPYPEQRLYSLINQKEKDFVKKDFVQNIPVSFFRDLKRGDILFVDSSHVSKYGSDLNYIMFEILPVLGSGVIIHFHDIFFPFEYPAEWIKQGRSWNEAYMMRAFLQHNPAYEILVFTSFLEKKYRSWFEANMPLCLTRHERIALDNQVLLMETSGQSLYIIKK